MKLTANTHKCPARGCSKRVPNEKAFCEAHWRQVPRALRNRIWTSYRAGQAGTAEHIELLAKAAQAIRLAREARSRRPTDQGA